MSLGGILILVLLVVSLFVFIYLLVVTARSWGVLQSILLSFLFIECWVFLFFTARVADRRIAQLKDYYTTREQVEKLAKDVQRLTVGGDNLGEEQEALIPLSGNVRRLTADRGRVWRNVARLNVEGEQIRVELAPAAPPAQGEDLTAPPAAAPAAPAANEQITVPVNMVVYAFSQVPNEANQPMPKDYIGEFKVVEAAGAQVLLKPLSTLEPRQAKARDEETTWSLYELLPQDNHESFVTAGAASSDEAYFGAPDEQTLNKLLAEIPDTDNRRQRVIATYMHDGQQAQVNDSQDSVWSLVEVVKPYKVDVDKSNPENATTGGYFDADGRALDMRLMRGEEKEVTLPEGKQLLVPQSKETSDLIANGTLKLIRPVFVRPLNAYQQSMDQLKIRRNELARLVEVAARETKLLQDANDQAQATKQAYVEKQQKFVADRTKYQQELAVLANEIQSVTNKFEVTRNQMIKFYQTLHSMHDSMVGR